MLNNILFNFLLLATCLLAVARGDGDSRMAAGICLVAAVSSLIVVRPLASRYSGVEVGVLLVDVLTLAAFVWLALRSTHFWPLWISGLQLTTLLAHLSMEVESALLPRAYAAAAVFWSYPILIIIAVGAWREHQRRLLET